MSPQHVSGCKCHNGVERETQNPKWKKKKKKKRKEKNKEGKKKKKKKKTTGTALSVQYQPQKFLDVVKWHVVMCRDFSSSYVTIVLTCYESTCFLLLYLRTTSFFEIYRSRPLRDQGKKYRPRIFDIIAILCFSCVNSMETLGHRNTWFKTSFYLLTKCGNDFKCYYSVQHKINGYSMSTPGVCTAAYHGFFSF